MWYGRDNRICLVSIIGTFSYQAPLVLRDLQIPEGEAPLPEFLIATD
jgi:hypothetical protein